MTRSIANTVDYAYYDASEPLKVIIETAEIRAGGDRTVLDAITRDPAPAADATTRDRPWHNGAEPQPHDPIDQPSGLGHRRWRLACSTLWVVDTPSRRSVSGTESCDCGDFFSCQRYRLCGKVFLQVRDAAGAGDGQGCR